MPTEGLQITKFSEAADLSDEILKAVEKMGFSEMTPVQAKTLPLMMEGRDLIAIAPTGTGKTCAFGIPMLEYVSLKDKRVQELVLAPTRELSLQITDELRALARRLGLSMGEEKIRTSNRRTLIAAIEREQGR